MEQINNIQVGNLTYQIGRTGSGSATGGASGGLTKWNQNSLATVDGVTLPFVFARANTLSAINCSYASSGVDCVIAGLPQDFMGESGELWSMEIEKPIVVSHDSTDIEGHPHKACVSVLLIKDVLDENSSLSEAFNSLLSQHNSVNTILKLHSTSKFLELTESDSVFVEFQLGAGMSIRTEQLSVEAITELASMIQLWYSTGSLVTGSKLITAYVLGLIINMALDITGDETSGYFAYSSSYVFSINSLEPGSTILLNGNPVGFLIDIRDNYVEAASEAPQYVFGVYNPSEEALITNIPVWWDNDTPPTFAGNDTMVKISLFGYIGSYTTVHIPVDEILDNLP